MVGTLQRWEKKRSIWDGDSWWGHFLAIVGHLGNSLPGPFHRPLNGRVTYCKHFTAADNDHPGGRAGKGDGRRFRPVGHCA